MSEHDSTYPIYDPAVTTPREVLVGESPIDRIAAPAQQKLKRWLIFGEDAFDVFQSDDLQAALSAASFNSAVIDTHTGKLIKVKDNSGEDMPYKLTTVAAIPIEDHKFTGKSMEDGYGNTLEYLTSIYPKE